MAEFAARCMGNQPGVFKAYKPNDNDDTFWTIDQANDWKLRFFDEKPKEIEVFHRYDDIKAIAYLYHWLAYRSGGTVIKK